MSEACAVPGNASLAAQERRARAELFYTSSHEPLDACLGERRAHWRPTALLTVRSSTPVDPGARRAVELSILHDADARPADMPLDAWRADRNLVARRDATGGPEDGVTHTPREHAPPRRLLGLTVEKIHDNLIVDAAGQRAAAERPSRRPEEAPGAGLPRAGGGRDADTSDGPPPAGGGGPALGGAAGDA